jgi:hypothetical protein
LTEFQRRGPEQARLAGTQLVFVENTLKVQRGLFAAVADRKLMERKRSEEAALRKRVAAQNELQRRFGGAWDAIGGAMERRRQPWLRQAAIVRLNGSELFAQAQTLVRFADEHGKPNERRLPEFTDAALPALQQQIAAKRPYDKELETMVLAHALTHQREQFGLDDPAVKALLGKKSPDEVATAAVRDTTLHDPTSATFGTIKGWNEGDHEVTPFTRIAGLYERHTGSAPFALPARWLDRKAAVAMDTPFNLVADTDIIGGNSGSPMIDRQGRIVGLVFDGNIHSIGGDYWFDAAKNRTVAVDSRGIREALKSIYQAERVLQEIDGK